MRASPSTTQRRDSRPRSSWCGPSRASFLTGREPTEAKVYSLHDGGFRRTAGGDVQTWQTLPEFFQSRGYRSLTAGKVFHPDTDDDASERAWTKIMMPNVYQPMGYVLGNCLGKRADTSWVALRDGATRLPSRLLRPFSCRSSAPLSKFDDFIMARAAAQELDAIARARRERRALAGNESSLATAPPQAAPFFMAVGFVRPHYPLLVHDSFWNLYGFDVSAMSDATYVDPPEPEDAMPPNFAIKPDALETGQIPPVYHGVASRAFRRGTRLAYSAAFSQADAALGVVLDALERTGLADATAVMLTSDNGFSLGDSSLWYKQLLTDHSTRVPLLLSLPWRAPARAVESDAHVELLDVYRTLADVAGLAPHLARGVRGRSLLPLYLGEPATAPSRAPFEWAASLAPRCGRDRECRGDRVTQMGFSVRTRRWRYNVWLRQGNASDGVSWSAPRSRAVGEELYDHGEPAEFEPVDEHFNLAREPASDAVKDALFAKLKERFEGVS